MTPPLTVIHVARRPLCGTVAANALKHGTGSLNIDGTRLGTGEDLGRTQNEQMCGPCMSGGGSTGWQGGTTGSTKGRWPANVVLEHLPECERVGTKRVKGTSVAGQVPIRRSGVHSPAGGHQTIGREQTPTTGFSDEDGMEEVESWACAPGCPVADIDEQSGVTHSAGGRTANISDSSHIYGGGKGLGQELDPEEVRGDPGFGDTGGASRYFKQSQHDIIEYLRTMISTPDRGVAFVINMDRWPEDIASWGNGSICGLVVRGAVQQEHVDEFMRLLPPGGHLILIAPDSQPTGHTGAILAEDAGFEIRDAILWVRGPGRVHYVAKAGRKEREAGCAHLKAKSGHEAVEREEGSAGVDNPRAGAGRTAKKVRNFHPTVKPIKVMRRLLTDVPKDQGPVLDPFMGSGTTGIACSMTGHDFIGIERDPEYLPIADARIRHWDRAHVGWQEATIESDLEPEQEKEVPDLDLFDLLD